MTAPPVRTPRVTPRKSPAGAGPGRPKDLEKRAAILEAAKGLFLSRGFGATSMDAVAAGAGVSKLTVYNHFSDKDTLFLEAVKAKCEEQMPHEIFEGQARGPIRRRLLSIARAFHALITSDDARAHRLTLRIEYSLQPAKALGIAVAYPRCLRLPAVPAAGEKTPYWAQWSAGNVKYVWARGRAPARYRL